MELTFSIAACTVLGFGFVAKTVANTPVFQRLHSIKAFPFFPTLLPTND